MQIASVSNAYGQGQSVSSLASLGQQGDSAGQNLPGQAYPARSDHGGVVSSPRASLTASATAVLSQSMEDQTGNSFLEVSRQLAAYQNSMNAQGLYGYQATLGALIG